MSINQLNQCLACGSSGLTPVLDLGSQPLANSYTNESSELPLYPLAICFCQCCSHVQLTHSVDPEELFRDYVYVSGTTSTLRNFFDNFAKDYVNSLGSQLEILELASNDGSLLEILSKYGHSTLGVDPAANLIGLAASKGVTTVCDFWPGKIADRLKPTFSVIVAMNVLAHVPDPLGFLRAAERCLATGGRIFVQTSQANMFMNGEFDTIYHEHLSFFNVRSMKELVRRSGLVLTDVSILPIHGGSYLWSLRRQADGGTMVETSRESEELEFGLQDLRTYERFSGIALETVSNVKQCIEELQESGFKTVGYGAAAKGNTFLNYSRIDLACIFDDNEFKQGFVTPGRNIPVVAPEQMSLMAEPLVFIVPAWNFVDEIREQIRRLRPDANDMILTYFPKLSIQYVQNLNRN